MIVEIVIAGSLFSSTFIVCCWLRHGLNQHKWILWQYGMILAFMVDWLELAHGRRVVEVAHGQQIRVLMQSARRMLVEEVFREKLWMLLPHYWWREFALVDCASGIARSKLAQSINDDWLVDLLKRFPEHVCVCVSLYASRVRPLLLLIDWRFDLELPQRYRWFSKVVRRRSCSPCCRCLHAF